MTAHAELMAHNQRNISLLARLFGKKLTPAYMAMIARFRTMLVKPVPVLTQNANPETAQHEATLLLAGELQEEYRLMAFVHQFQGESFA